MPLFVGSCPLNNVGKFGREISFYDKYEPSFKQTLDMTMGVDYTRY